ncbi:MAG: hypothetical protein JWN33_261 [Candidatus Saccharibacteria bacterium]|nr:hypothetical protein [Candidatus Saccharibacteria bacterium]
MSWQHEERTPVIIAAFNEEKRIANTLAALDVENVAPLVMVNGSSDRTAEIARQYTDQVIELEEQGKFPALQRGVEILGRQGLHGVLFIDADSVPRHRRIWADEMTFPFITNPGPMVTAGRLRFTEGSSVANGIRTLRRQRDFAASARRQDSSSVYGANMGVQFHTEDIRDEFLALPHVWPGEDKLTADLIMEHGGKVKYLASPYSDVHTSSRYHISLLERLVKGKRNAVTQNDAGYLARSPNAARASYVDGRIVPFLPKTSGVISPEA